MMRKHLHIACYLSLATLFATACGTPSSSTVASDNSVPKEISLVGFDTPVLQDLLTKHFPQYHFTFYQTYGKPSLSDLIAQGQAVDMVLESYGAFSAPGFALSLGLQYDMSDLVKKYKLDLNRFDQSAIQGIQEFGGLYGVPFTSNAMVLYYNKDLFDKYGVSYPKDGMTWDQVTELVKQMTRVDSGTQYVGLAQLDLGHPFNSNQLSVPYVDPQTGKSSIATDAWRGQWKEIFQTYFLNFTAMDGYQSYLKAHNNQFPNTDTFGKDRTAAMYLYFADTWTNTPSFKDVNWDMVSMPTLKEKPGVGSQPYPAYLCVSQGSKNKDDDIKIIEYLTSDEVQTQYSKLGYVTALKNDTVRKAYATGTDVTGKNFKAVFYDSFAPMPKGTTFDQMVQRAMIKAMTPTLTDAVDLNTAFQQAGELSDQAIEEAKQQGIKQNN
ncbi:MAG: extracellular solute-binding protein family 1 [Bacilli bacterium]|nr:extracellular solute-binding protein family 1 [Bacilli bacterium]